jgi:hypothetical protein
MPSGKFRWGECFPMAWHTLSWAPVGHQRYDASCFEKNTYIPYQRPRCRPVKSLHAYPRPTIRRVGNREASAVVRKARVCRFAVPSCTRRRRHGPSVGPPENGPRPQLGKTCGKLTFLPLGNQFTSLPACEKTHRQRGSDVVPLPDDWQNHILTYSGERVSPDRADTRQTWRAIQRARS